MASLKRPRTLARAMDALAQRLQVLQESRACCVDLRALVAAVPPLAGDQAVHEALADHNRLTIVALLARTPDLCGCEIQAALEISHPTVSHHMGVLQKAALVDATRRGRWVHYALTPLGRRMAP